LSLLALVSVPGISLPLILVTFGFAWFFRSNLRLPIENLAQAFDRIDASARTGERLPVRSTTHPNELDQVAISGNRFLGELETHLAERRRVNDALRESEKRVTAILQNTGEGIITIDQTGLVTSFNKGAENIFGYSAEEIIGQNVAILSPPEERPAHDGYVTKSSLHESRIINTARDLHGCRKDGTLFPLELHVTRMGEGEDKSFIGIMRDNTERMEAQHKLEQAVVSAESANMAKSEFLSSMSHELRTPMNTVLGFSQLLETDEDTPLTDDQRNSVEHIVRSGKHLLALINDVLDMSRIESGKVEVSWEWIELAPLVSTCIDEMKPAAEPRNVKITNDVPGDAGQMWADYTKVRQVLLNLLSNAVKYNHLEGDVQVALQSTAEGYVRIAVTDTGPGLSDAQIANIFIPFDRLGAEMSDIQGTGIGLSITQRLVGLMDGQIGVDSTPGKGSTFWIEFAANNEGRDVSGEVIKTVVSLSEPGSQDVHPFDRAHKILYVEDNPANLELMERILERRSNCSYFLAATGTEGYELARNEQPDAIILDINLPDLDGLQLLKRLQATECTSKIPVVALTAAAMSEQIKTAERAGFAAYLTKPVDFNILNSTLDNIMNIAETN
jgi:PAS domain S-box-containing protein